MHRMFPGVSSISVFHPDVLEKTAATWWISKIRRLVEEGRWAEAEALSEQVRDSGAMKLTEQGSQIKVLKPGTEGPKQLAVGSTLSESPFVGTKAFDPAGPRYTKGLPGETLRNYKKLQQIPEIAHLFPEMYSKKVGRGKTGARFLVSEFVRGEPIRTSAEHRALRGTEQEVQSITKRMNVPAIPEQRGLAQTIGDLGAHNALMVPGPNGPEVKYFDFATGPKDLHQRVSQMHREEMRGSVGVPRDKAPNAAAFDRLVEKRRQAYLAGQSFREGGGRLPESAYRRVADPAGISPPKATLRSADTARALRGFGTTEKVLPKIPGFLAPAEERGGGRFLKMLLSKLPK